MLKYKIYSYFLKDLIKNYLIILFSLSSLIWLTQSGRLLDLITEHGISIDIYIQYVLLFLPKIIRQVMLLSFFISLFYTLIKFQNLNELNIYWLSGVNKSKIINIIFFFGLLVFLLDVILSAYVAPYTSFKGRTILAKAEFKIINSLVKEKNFNSPLKNLNIYVEENDQNGNLEKVFIYEKDRTIIAKKGRVLLDKNKFILELKNGFTHENNNENINVVKFDTTTLDISNYKPSIIDYPKFSERNTNWIINEINKPSKENILKKGDLIEELNKRFIYPLFIFLLCIVSCFIILKNFEKFSTEKIRALVFGLGVLLMILNEALLTISGKSLKYTLIYFSTPILLTLILYLVLNLILKKENKINL